MSPASHIPLPGRGLVRKPCATVRPAFSAPVRWTLVVLSWLAFGVAAYLAFHSVSGTSVAGCGVGNANGCDMVLSSSWSKWLGIPVAVLGLACYSALASLSLLLGLRNEAANHWITTLFVMLAVVAAGASLWFIGVQVFAIGDYCKFCLVTDAIGIVLGILASAAALQSILARRGTPQARTMQPGLMALRTTMPAARSAAPTTALPSSPPSLFMALGGALPLLVLLIGGQLLFASKTYQEENLTLSNAIKLDNSADPAGAEPSSPTTRVVMRPTGIDAPPPQPIQSGETPSESPAKDVSAIARVDNPSLPTESPSATEKLASDDNAKTAANPLPSEPAKQRLVKFLNGKLTLDVYQHPLIGSHEAPHIAIEMVSYDCPHCRKMHEIVEQALARYGNQVAVLIMPVPLDKDCNKLITDPTLKHPGACGTAKLVIALAKLQPSRFSEFHNFLMSGGDKPPGIEKVIPKAYGMASSDRLRELMYSPEVAKQLDSYVELFGQLQRSSKNSSTFGLPVQILGDHVTSGEVKKPEDVFKAWEENLGVKPQ